MSIFLKDIIITIEAGPQRAVVKGPPPRVDRDFARFGQIKPNLDLVMIIIKGVRIPAVDPRN